MPMALAIRSLFIPLAGYNGLTLFSQRLPALICLLFLIASVPSANALPVVSAAVQVLKDDDSPKSPDNPSLWVYLGTAVFLVIAGGAFAGLTIAYDSLSTLCFCVSTDLFIQVDGTG